MFSYFLICLGWSSFLHAAVMTVQYFPFHRAFAHTCRMDGKAQSVVTFVQKYCDISVSNSILLQNNGSEIAYAQDVWNSYNIEACHRNHNKCHDTKQEAVTKPTPTWKPDNEPPRLSTLCCSPILWSCSTSFSIFLEMCLKRVGFGEVGRSQTSNAVLFQQRTYYLRLFGQSSTTGQVPTEPLPVATRPGSSSKGEGTVGKISSRCQRSGRGTIGSFWQSTRIREPRPLTVWLFWDYYWTIYYPRHCGTRNR